MVKRNRSAEQAAADTLAGWSEILEELCERIACRFRRPEVRTRVRRYLTGLLGEVGRKNSWQLAESMGERRPRGVQHLLNEAHWDADAVRDDLSWTLAIFRRKG